MALSVFISHSVAPWELGIVEGIAAEARNRGAFTFISHRDYRPDAPLPEDVRKALIGSDYLLAIATTDGRSYLRWLNREVLERSNRKSRS